MDRRFRWMVALLGLIVAVGVGVLSYNAGVAHGIAVSPAIAAAPGAAAIPYGWYRPWGFGLFGPVFFLLFWFLVFGVFSRIWWAGSYRHRRWSAAGGCGSPAGLDEWHRRAHEEMKKPS